MQHLQDKILEIIQDNYNETTGTNEAELYSSIDIANLAAKHAKDDAVGFCNWVSANAFAFEDGWYYHGDYYTTEDLYNIYDAGKNN
jgi:hypothetical protein